MEPYGSISAEGVVVILGMIKVQEAEAET